MGNIKCLLQMVYPRACGGTLTVLVAELQEEGLSPRLRGNRIVKLLGFSCSRVYPRACGGTPMMQGCGGPKRGLSPRLRGNHYSHNAQDLFVRSIPALAGEPLHFGNGASHRRVYPRACGGTSAHSWANSGLSGLSPRLRGNRCCRMVQNHGCWSIPALAGEPGRDAPARPTRHGLSPRLRGNPPIQIAYLGKERSIPALAGEPVSRS